MNKSPTTYTMNHQAIDTATDPDNQDLHADKFNDPRAKITRRGILIGIAVVLFGIAGAAASIYGRRTRLEKTTEFWGEETITALQLGERIELKPHLGRDFRPVDLSGMPGLGHLRHALLDELHFDWGSRSDQSVTSHNEGADDPFCVTLRITDPTAHRFKPVEIDLDLNDGWAGHHDPGDSAKHRGSVQVVARKRNGLKHFLVTIMDKENLRADKR